MEEKQLERSDPSAKVATHKNDKKRNYSHYSLHFYFILIGTISVFCAILVTSAASLILSRILGITLTLPLTGWAFVSVLIVSAVFSVFLSKKFFHPIRGLSRSMNAVAKGDFSVREVTDSNIREIRELYESFNLMTRELGATEILQTDFVSNVSHEFKTPLAAIEGYATLLQDPQMTREEHEQYVEKILLNTKRLSELVGNILLLSKVENQAIPARSSRFRLDEQIRAAIVALEPKWSRKDIELAVELDRVEHFGNESLLYHVWANILDNAIKFSPNGAVLAVSMTAQEDRVTVRIDDRGPGISPTDIAHIFDKFYQSDSSHKAEGNGLGLALVKRILDVSNGTVSAENRPEGGCSFTVVLKTEVPPIRPTFGRASTENAPRIWRKRRVSNVASRSSKTTNDRQ